MVLGGGIRFSKDLIFLVPSPENEDNWIYSNFYISLAIRIRSFKKIAIIPYTPRN